MGPPTHRQSTPVDNRCHSFKTAVMNKHWKRVPNPLSCKTPGNGYLCCILNSEKCGHFIKKAAFINHFQRVHGMNPEQTPIGRPKTSAKPRNVSATASEQNRLARCGQFSQRLWKIKKLKCDLLVRIAVGNQAAAPANCDLAKWVLMTAETMYKRWRQSDKFMASVKSIHANVIEFWQSEIPGIDVEDLLLKANMPKNPASYDSDGDMPTLDSAKSNILNMKLVWINNPRKKPDVGKRQKRKNVDNHPQKQGLQKKARVTQSPLPEQQDHVDVHAQDVEECFNEPDREWEEADRTSDLHADQSGEEADHVHSQKEDKVEDCLVEHRCCNQPPESTLVNTHNISPKATQAFSSFFNGFVPSRINLQWPNKRIPDLEGSFFTKFMIRQLQRTAATFGFTKLFTESTRCCPPPTPRMASIAICPVGVLDCILGDENVPLGDSECHQSELLFSNQEPCAEESIQEPTAEESNQVPTAELLIQPAQSMTGNIYTVEYPLEDIIIWMPPVIPMHIEKTVHTPESKSQYWRKYTDNWDEAKWNIKYRLWTMTMVREKAPCVLPLPMPPKFHSAFIPTYIQHRELDKLFMPPWHEERLKESGTRAMYNWVYHARKIENPFAKFWPYLSCKYELYSWVGPDGVLLAKHDEAQLISRRKFLRRTQLSKGAHTQAKLQIGHLARVLEYPPVEIDPPPSLDPQTSNPSI